MREFNTSGQNNPKRHYTLMRPALVQKGMRLVDQERYFTIWAPRQTGKSTYFMLLAEALEQAGYKVAYINFEDYTAEPLPIFLEKLLKQLNKFWGTTFDQPTLGSLFNAIEEVRDDKKLVLIVDEVEGINREYFGNFLHSIRRVYHSRERHALKSVILVGVANITGIVQDHASPFNIADNLDVPFFTDNETRELLAQHETETGQLFAPEVKAKISEITANQPGLVNGFASKLVTDYIDKAVITYADYLVVEDWYIYESIDKNVSNIISKAKLHRTFVENLLFRDHKVHYRIDRPAIKVLHTNGLIKRDKEGYVKFWVPLYRKKLFYAFYPYTNGEKDIIQQTIPVYDILDEQNNLNLTFLIQSFKHYIQKRSFRPFREKDQAGNFKSIKEAVMVYSFETYIHAFLEMVNAKSYREAQTSLGNTDLIINVEGKEYLIETKMYRYDRQFQEGKQQVAYYAKKLGIQEAVYLVFVPNNIRYPERAKEDTKIFDGVKVQTFLVIYDEEKDF